MMSHWMRRLGWRFGVLVAVAAGCGPAMAGSFLPPLPYGPPAGMTLTSGRPTNALMLRTENTVDPMFLRQVVAYATAEHPGTIVVDTGHKFLYFVLGGGRAMRYGIGTAREGFEWGGVHTITRKAEWPGWTPPSEMLVRQPGIPHHMAGGIDNPLGARALYIGTTLYRIHGTNEPWTIGGDVSSGCIRMTNSDVIDLYAHVRIGTKVIVL